MKNYILWFFFFFWPYPPTLPWLKISGSLLQRHKTKALPKAHLFVLNFFIFGEFNVGYAMHVWGAKTQRKKWHNVLVECRFFRYYNLRCYQPGTLQIWYEIGQGLVVRLWKATTGSAPSGCKWAVKFERERKWGLRPLVSPNTWTEEKVSCQQNFLILLTCWFN